MYPLNNGSSVARVERETGFEPATLALARRCSTTELFPHPHSTIASAITAVKRKSLGRLDRQELQHGLGIGLHCHRLLRKTNGSIGFFQAMSRKHAYHNRILREAM